MGGFIPHAPGDLRHMLDRVGVDSLDALYQCVPEAMRLASLNLDAGLSEMAVDRKMRGLAATNTVFERVFRGAGAYCHYIPAIVKSVVTKETFVTAYTPYQAEMSQGILQSIFEYQTMICRLTGMDVANASLYDGATAAAEAVHLCVDKKRPVALVLDNVRPMTLETIRTYCAGSDTELHVVETTDGALDADKLADALDGRVGCVYLEQPSYFGLIEDAEVACDMAHAAGAKFVMGVNPIACAILKTPGELGADVAVGEGQPLGMPLSFGGPYLGFLSAKAELIRKLPGRIVGETTDAQGRRAFVLTLQAREQHIRREKASSNICSNQALCAMTAACYLAAMGERGLVEVATQCHAKAAYLQAQLAKIKGFARLQDGAFFHEFATACPMEAEVLMERLAARGILGGLPIPGGILWCATEMNAKADIDALIEAIKEAIA